MAIRIGRAGVRRAIRWPTGDRVGVRPPGSTEGTGAVAEAMASIGAGTAAGTLIATSGDATGVACPCMQQKEHGCEVEWCGPPGTLVASPSVAA